MKWKPIFVCTLFLLVVSKTYCQEENNITRNVTKVNFLLPGVSYEQKISRITTLYLSAYLNFLLSSRSSAYGTSTKVSAGPSFDFQVRNYYNYRRRSNNGLRTEFNSMNYIAPVYTGTYASPVSSSSRKLISQFGVVWGMQRNYASRFSLDLNIGVGYMTGVTGASNNNSVTLLAEFVLGFWLNRKS